MERYRPLLDKLQNKQPKKEWDEPLSPLQRNEMRAESYYFIQEVRREIEDERRKIDDMVARVNMRVSQPYTLAKKIYCNN